MTRDEDELGLGRLVVLGAFVGLVSALACIAILGLAGAELDPAVIGGVAGGVTGGVVPAVVLRRRRAARRDDPGGA